MESQPQNPEIRIKPENFHPCKHLFEIRLVKPNCVLTTYTFELMQGKNKQKAQWAKRVHR